MIRRELTHGVLSLTIDRPEVLNALDLAHLRSLREQLGTARDNPDVRCVVLRGAGRAFSVGADIREMDVMTSEQFEEAAGLYQDLARDCRGLDQPIIAAVGGYALGGGLELALMSDIRIAGRSATLGLPDAELGFSPTGGLTYLLTRVVGSGWALHLALTGERLDAAAALRIGLVTEVVDDDGLRARATALAERVAGYPRTGIRNIKRSFTAAAESGLAASLMLEAEYDAACYRDPETRARLQAFIAARGNG